MDTRRLFLWLAVIAGTLAKPADEVDLNLKSIFRTPRDFSKVNFDHFELLERNNFKDGVKETASTSTQNKETGKAEDKHSKSVANAQVMLRIGGEDIHDCNRVILHHSPSVKEHSYYNEHHHQHQPVYNNPYYSHPYNSYPYVHQPYSFPRYYYNPGPLPNYLPSGYQTVDNHLVPNELATKPPSDSETTVTYIEEGENPHQAVVKTEICTETPKPQVIIEKPSHYGSHVKVTDIVHAPVEEKVCITHPQHVQATVVETSCCLPTQTEVVPTHECTTATPLCAVTTPEPIPHKIEYVEVNLVSTEKPCVEPSKEEHPCVEPPKEEHHCMKPPKEEHPCLEPPKEEHPCVEPPKEEHPCELIQHDFVPVPAPHESSVVVSHTDVEKPACVSPQEEFMVPETPSSSYCEPCNNERDSSIPYGHRFSKDADSLQEIADNALYNEEGIINDGPPLEPRKLEISAPVHEESHSQCTSHEIVQVVNPCHQATEQQYEAQDNRPTNIETACETKSVIEEQPEYQQAATVGDVEWSPQKVCQPSSQEAPSETVEPSSESQEVVHVGETHSNPHSNSQTEWSHHQEDEESTCETKPKPVVYHSGYKSRGGSHIDVSRHSNQRPKVYVDGYNSRYGSSCYSDPVRSIVYRHPRILDPYRYSNPLYPVVERIKYIDHHSGLPIREHVRIVHPLSSFYDGYRCSPVRHHGNVHHKFSEPHIYKIVPKYNIIPRRDIRQLNIPDLVPTNQYLKINPQHRQGSHREYDNVEKESVSRNEYYVRKPQYWKNVPVQREVPEGEDCKPCSRYRGELDELS